MRAALIILNADAQDAIEVAGRSLPLRQLDFALAAGCELIIGLGNGAGEDALAVRHAAEKEGARFRAITNARAIPALLAPSDDLLVLQGNVLPASRDALAAFSGSGNILTLPGDVARPGGFERIDLNRSWAGAMLLPAGLADGLQSLDEDFDAPSTLLRLALQYGIAERPLALEMVDTGQWAVLTQAKAADQTRGWLARHIPPVSGFAPARWLAQKIVRLGAGKFGSKPGTLQTIIGLAALSGLAALGAAWFGLHPAAFAAVALAAVMGQAAILLSRLQSAPFGKTGKVTLVTLVPDIALFACSFLAIEGAWFERLFPPLMLLAVLRFLPFHGDREWMRILRDRLLIAVILALAAGVGLQQPATMIAAFLALLPNLRIFGANRG